LQDIPQKINTRTVQYKIPWRYYEKQRQKRRIINSLKGDHIYKNRKTDGDAMCVPLVKNENPLFEIIHKYENKQTAAPKRHETRQVGPTP
jgi:hypothetical protein